MNFFGIGLPEMAVIAAIGLLVFGPKRLPELGRTLGRTLKGFQSASSEFEKEFRTAISTTEVSSAEVSSAEVSSAEVKGAESPSLNAGPDVGAQAEAGAASAAAAVAAPEAGAQAADPSAPPQALPPDPPAG